MIEIQEDSSAKSDMLLRVKPKLLMIFGECAYFCWKKDFDILITSIIRRQTTDSGVHSLGRAIDFLITTKQGAIMPFSNIHQNLLDEINNKYVYDNKRTELKTLIWHRPKDVTFGGLHFHLQVM